MSLSTFSTRFSTVPRVLNCCRPPPGLGEPPAALNLLKALSPAPFGMVLSQKSLYSEQLQCQLPSMQETQYNSDLACLRPVSPEACEVPLPNLQPQLDADLPRRQRLRQKKGYRPCKSRRNSYRSYVLEMQGALTKDPEGFELEAIAIPTRCNSDVAVRDAMTQKLRQRLSALQAELLTVSGSR